MYVGLGEQSLGQEWFVLGSLNSFISVGGKLKFHFKQGYGAENDDKIIKIKGDLFKKPT